MCGLHFVPNVLPMSQTLTGKEIEIDVEPSDTVCFRSLLAA